MLETKIAGLTFPNPIMPAAGPLTGDLEKILYIASLGVGGMVTKTISVEAATVQRPCIWAGHDSVMNNEKWSELSPKKWAGEILPAAKAALEIPLIVSMGYTHADMATLVPMLEPFADAYEISTHYVGKDLSTIARTVAAIRKLTHKPFFMKISPHIPDPAAFARMVWENGGNGIAAINSLGPTMRIDIGKRQAIIGNDAGQAWTSGPAIKPLALAIVNIIKEAVPEMAVIGTGGIASAEDVVEFLLAGAGAVQLLSSAFIYGKDIYRKIIDDLPGVLQKYGFTSIEDVTHTGISKGGMRYEPGYPMIDTAKCKRCRQCERACPYFAMSYDMEIKVDKEKCFGCGLCESRCAKHAISGVL